MSSIKSFIEGYMTGNAWEDLCVRCYRIRSKLERDFSSRFTEASIGELKQDLIASWLADCSMEFRG